MLISKENSILPYTFKIKYLYGIETKKQKHTIHVSEPHPQSAAMLLLLKKYYVGISTKSSNSCKGDWRLWLTFRNRYLKRMKKQEGSLTCFFCGLENLHSNTNSSNAIGIEATIDHFVPTSKGGKKYDEKNLKVCCLRCNHNKTDLSPEAYINVLKNNHLKYGSQIHPQWLEKAIDTLVD